MVGVAFLAVGVLGFIPGITTDYGTLNFGGHHSGAKPQPMGGLVTTHSPLAQPGLVRSRMVSRASTAAAIVGRPRALLG